VSSSSSSSSTKETQKPEAAAAIATGPLEQLRAGKIDVNTYVELKLDEATEHLKGLHTSEMQSIRVLLRDKIVADPQLADLVRQATGPLPTPHDE
jgi:hypothetical protein